MSNGYSGYRRILVATDFSPSAESALAQATWVAKQAQSEVVLAHVVADLRHAVAHTSYRSRLEFLEGEEEHFQRELRRESDEKLKHAIHHLGEADIKITYETLLGTPYVELIHSVQQEGYDLVMVGSRGHGVWQQLVLGSTARRLIRKCPGSVWVDKQGTAKQLSSIVVAVELSEESRRALEQAAWLANCAGADLHVLHVIEHQIPDSMLELKSASTGDRTVREFVEDEAKKSFEQLLAGVQVGGSKLHRHLVWGIPGQEIVNLAKEVHADLIAMGTVGRSGIQGLLLGNTAETVVTHSECDVLTVKPAGFQSPITPPTWPLHPGPEDQSE